MAFASFFGYAVSFPRDFLSRLERQTKPSRQTWPPEKGEDEENNAVPLPNNPGPSLGQIRPRAELRKNPNKIKCLPVAGTTG
jgi:hypothetical protein